MTTIKIALAREKEKRLAEIYNTLGDNGPMERITLLEKVLGDSRAYLCVPKAERNEKFSYDIETLLRRKLLSVKRERNAYIYEVN